MSNQNYIINILNLKENNLIFKENFYCEEKINGITHKIFEAYLSYNPTCCSKCGVVFDSNFEKHGFITSNIKIPDVSGFKSIFYRALRVKPLGLVSCALLVLCLAVILL
jgi:hypothetical protein